MPKIVTTLARKMYEKYQVCFPEGWEVIYLEAPFTEEKLSAACHGAEYLLVSSMHDVTARVIGENRQLKMIHTNGTGHDRVDLAAAKECGIYVCHNRAVNNAAVAEHAIGLMLAGLRQTVRCSNDILDKGFAASQQKARMVGQRELGSQHVGIVGFGAIGREVAKRLKGWDCRVSYYDAFRPEVEVEQALRVGYLELEELLSSCDVITLHVPVLPSTRKMINAETIALMKPEVLLINTARGELIDQEALREALVSGRIYGACLDVFTPEPVPTDLPLLNLPEEVRERLIVTPHIAGTTDEAFTRMLQWSINNVQRMENGEEPINQVRL